MNGNFRGTKHVVMITVLEGKGTPDNPYREVKYFYDMNLISEGSGIYLGKIDPCEDK